MAVKVGDAIRCRGRNYVAYEQVFASGRHVLCIGGLVVHANWKPGGLRRALTLLADVANNVESRMAKEIGG